MKEIDKDGFYTKINVNPMTTQLNLSNTLKINKIIYKIIKIYPATSEDGELTQEIGLEHIVNQEPKGKGGYLICKECRGYYKLQDGELPVDFTDKCDCGGKLRYALSIDVVGENKIFQNTKNNNDKGNILNSWPVALLCLIMVIPLFYVVFYLFGNTTWIYILIVLSIGITGMYLNKHDDKSR
jgi:hypothetical protein